MQQRSIETRQKIITAALTLFSKQGFDATGVAEICELAHVSKGAFYYHFPSKRTVFLALFQDWLSSLDQQMDAVQHSDFTVPETLRLMTGLIPQIITTAGDHLQIFLEFWTQASRDPAMWQATIEPYHHYQVFFAELIAQGIREGSLENVDQQIAARIIVALALGLLLQGMFDPVGANWEEVSQQGIDLLLDGIT